MDGAGCGRRDGGRFRRGGVAAAPQAGILQPLPAGRRITGARGEKPLIAG
jgi:hypothetical protein